MVMSEQQLVAVNWLEPPKLSKLQPTDGFREAGKELNLGDIPNSPAHCPDG
jgi:hypothetical protein